jgi:hypothetical protein
MKIKNWLATAALLNLAVIATPVLAQDATAFSALKSIDAQVLSQQEMSSVTGELNAYDIAAELQAYASTLGKYPKLQTQVRNLADAELANAKQINIVFAKLGILTPSKVH